MADPVVRASRLGKQFRIGRRRERYPTFRAQLAGMLATPARRLRHVLSGHGAGHGEGHELFWALRDVSFEVARGEVVGIIGKNGAGKSTLLKVLSRITEPSAGFVEIEGRVGSLLEVGTGFHPELTGRENVFMNGAILGMRRAEIERKFDEIGAFAEIEQFLDTPVKHYSSGMYVRLAFAVAAHLEPEVLIVDEVLSVGDAEFQRKCLGKMNEVAHEGRTVLFVSHNMGAINRLCTRALWIDRGRIEMSGAPDEVIGRYFASSGDSSACGERVWPDGLANDGVDIFALDAIRVDSVDGRTSGRLDVRMSFHVTIEYRVRRRLPTCRVGFLLRAADGTIVFDAYDTDDDRYAVPRQPGSYRSRCTIPGHLLSPGRYTIGVNAGIPGLSNLAFKETALTIDLVDTGVSGAHATGGRYGIIRPRLQWEQNGPAATPALSQTVGSYGEAYG